MTWHWTELGAREESGDGASVFPLEASVPRGLGQQEGLHEKGRGQQLRGPKEGGHPRCEDPGLSERANKEAAAGEYSGQNSGDTQGHPCRPSLFPSSSGLPQMAFQGDQYTFVGGKSAYWKGMTGLINTVF